MSEFKKIYCAFHDKQFITNFCVEANCCMPLCPNCIGAHNEFHKERGSKSTYNSIDNVLNHTSNSISNLVKSFENEQKRIENITGIISEMPLVLHQKLMVAKNMALNQIQKAFEKLEKEMVLKLCSKQEVVVGQNMKLVENQLKTISSSLTTLERMMKSLTGERCLSTVIKFLEHEHNDLVVIRDNLNCTVNSFECIEPFVNIDEQILQHIDPLLRSFVNIEFSESQESLNKTQSQNIFQFEEISSTFSPLISHMRQRIDDSKLQPIKDNIEKITTSRKEKEKFKCDNEIENLSKKIADMRKNNKIMSATLERRK